MVAFVQTDEFMNIWVTLIFLQLMDVLTTTIGLHLGGRELNPGITWLINHWGYGSIIFWKLLLVILLITIANIFKTRVNLPRLVTKINYIFALIVLWNTINIYYPLHF